MSSGQEGGPTPKDKLIKEIGDLRKRLDSYKDELQRLRGKEKPLITTPGKPTIMNNKVRKIIQLSQGQVLCDDGTVWEICDDGTVWETNGDYIVTKGEYHKPYWIYLSDIPQDDPHNHVRKTGEINHE